MIAQDGAQAARFIAQFMQPNQTRTLPSRATVGNQRRRLRYSLGLMALFLGFACLGELLRGSGQARKEAPPLARTVLARKSRRHRQVCLLSM